MQRLRDARVVSINGSGIHASDLKLSSSLRARLQTNLALVQERAAPLVAEAFLILAIQRMRSKRDDETSLSLTIDLEDFARFTETLARRFTRPTNPREHCPQKSNDSSNDEDPKSGVEDLCGRTNDEVDLIPELIRLIVEERGSSKQGAEMLYSYVQEYAGDSHFLAEEYQGRLREIEKETASTWKEKRAAKEISLLFSQFVQ